MSALVPHVSLDPLPLEITFTRIMCPDVGGSRMTRQAGLGVTFPCSSAGPWVPHVGLHFLCHLVSGLLEREVGWNDRFLSGSPSFPLMLTDCGGAGSVALARDRWEEYVWWSHQDSVRAR